MSFSFGMWATNTGNTNNTVMKRNKPTDFTTDGKTYGFYNAAAFAMSTVLG